MTDIVRDPETGRFVSVAEEPNLDDRTTPPRPSWGRAHVQHLGWGVQQEMDDDELMAVQDLEEVLSGRLDSNEVAELIGLDVETSLIYLTDQGSSADPTGVVGAVSLGLNMSVEEDPYWQADWAADQSAVQPFGTGEFQYDPIPGQTGSGDSGADGAGGEGKNVVARPGFLHGRFLAPASSFEDGAAGSGGAGSPVASEYDRIDYRDRFRMGPVADQSDEIRVRLGIAGGESVTGVYRIQCRASLYWQPVQVPGGRPEFELPNL